MAHALVSSEGRGSENPASPTHQAAQLSNWRCDSDHGGGSFATNDQEHGALGLKTQARGPAISDIPTWLTPRLEPSSPFVYETWKGFSTHSEEGLSSPGGA